MRIHRLAAAGLVALSITLPLSSCSDDKKDTAKSESSESSDAGSDKTEDTKAEAPTESLAPSADFAPMNCADRGVAFARLQLHALYGDKESLQAASDVIALSTQMPSKFKEPAETLKTMYLKFEKADSTTQNKLSEDPKVKAAEKEMKAYFDNDCPVG